MRVDDGKKKKGLKSCRDKNDSPCRGGEGAESLLSDPDLSSDYTSKGEGERKSARIMYVG